MDDAGFMGGLQCLRDLSGKRQRVFDRHRALRDAVGEGRTVNELQDERTGAVSLVLFNAVDLRDVRMVEAGENLGFALEPGQPIGVSRERVGEDLQRDIAAELGIGGT